MDNILSSRAMLAGVKISIWSARKLDKKVTRETNDAHGASADAGRYNKALLATDALSKIVAASSAARAYHYERTLPWLDDGARILPALAYETYATKLREIRGDFDSAVRAFVEDYPGFVADARARLNGMFNADDYPTADQIAGKFGFDVRILPVPDARDFRVDIGDAQGAEIRREVEKATREALDRATRDAWERITAVVGAMVEKLNAYKPAKRQGDKVMGIFRDSLVENVRDLVAILPSLNLTGNARLASICDRMGAELCAHDADALRDSDNFRTATAEAAESILAEVRDFLA